MADLLVCAKLVWDLENVLAEDWQTSQDEQSIPIDSVGKIMNTCDSNALELALRFQDRQAQDEVKITVLTMGDQRCRKMLTNARALGAWRSVRVEQTEEGAAYDSLRTARRLCEAIRLLGRFELLLFGISAGEYDMGQTGLLAAELLGVPVIQNVLSFDKAADGILIRYLTGDGEACTTIREPAVLTVGTPPDVYLRSPTLKAVMAAAKSQEEILELPVREDDRSGKSQDWIRIYQGEKTCQMLTAQEPQKIVELIGQLADQGEGTQ